MKRWFSMVIIWLARWFWNVLIALDQLANALIGGDPDETISSRLGKCSRAGCRACRIACRLLSLFDPRPGDHCIASLEDDEGKDAA